MFLLAIVPLGIGAGVPAPVILALGAGMLWREPAAPRMVIELVTTHRETHRRAA
jgi:hypothetical protein